MRKSSCLFQGSTLSGERKTSIRLLPFQDPRIPSWESQAPSHILRPARSHFPPEDLKFFLSFKASQSPASILRISSSYFHHEDQKLLLDILRITGFYFRPSSNLHPEDPKLSCFSCHHSTTPISNSSIHPVSYSCTFTHKKSILTNIKSYPLHGLLHF